MSFTTQLPGLDAKYGFALKFCASMNDKTFEFRIKAGFYKFFLLSFLHIPKRIQKKVGCFNLTIFFVSNVVDIKGTNLTLSNVWISWAFFRLILFFCFQGGPGFETGCCCKDCLFSSHWLSATKLALRVHPITLADGDRSITAIADITFVQ